ncbi:MAG: hydrogen peroxide-dependent heme synthase [Trebonia sp.]
MAEVSEDRARELAGMVKYAMYAAFRVRREYGGVAEHARQSAAAEVDQLCEQAASKGVATRGAYRLSGYRADADYLFWWIADSPDDLQDLYCRFLRTRLGLASDPAWSALGVHRPAEFNAAHVPSFIAGDEPRGYACFYPYARSMEWYLLDPAERGRMLAEHGRMGREFPDVLANTVSAFALGDYEFILTFEADKLHRLVDLMRHLRGARARLHTRIETPFYTGPRRSIREIVATLP